jgi:dihydrolipoamide dehydrogenase
MSNDHEVVILGGGPGGYAAALYGASAGLDIALIEMDKVGGTCLHRGCIPTKALLQTAEVARTVSHMGDFGFKHSNGGGALVNDFATVAKRNSGIVGRLHQGVQGLLKRRKVTVVNGRGAVTPDGGIAVDGTAYRGTKAVILATGSVPKSIPGFEIDEEWIITSDHATNLESLPKRAAVIGGGVVGTEFASVFVDMGVETSLFEALPGGVLPIGPDQDVAGVLAKALVKRGVKVNAQARVSAPTRTSEGLLVKYDSPSGSGSVEVDTVLVAIGRRPLTDGIGLSEAGIEVTEAGFIHVDPNTLATTRPGVFAIGDCIASPGLAHVAFAEAISVIRTVLGEPLRPVDYDRVPWVVYAHPEVAWVGQTEAAARAAGADLKVVKHPFAGNGRAMIIGDTEGMVKVISRKDGPLLGVHVVGPWASELISESYLALNWDALPEDVGAFVHAHPSLSEAIGETMISMSGRSLH